MTSTVPKTGVGAVVQPAALLVSRETNRERTNSNRWLLEIEGISVIS